MPVVAVLLWIGRILLVTGRFAITGYAGWKWVQRYKWAAAGLSLLRSAGWWAALSGALYWLSGKAGVFLTNVSQFFQGSPSVRFQQLGAVWPTMQHNLAWKMIWAVLPVTTLRACFAFIIGGIIAITIFKYGKEASKEMGRLAAARAGKGIAW